MDLTVLPKSPGVYLLKQGKNILYIGKALNVYERVRTHLLAITPANSKTKQMRDKVDNVDFISVRSDFEALLLEINLIKKHRPVYNQALKDDKDYLFLKITKEDFPRVLAVRHQDLKPYKFYLGPFPNSQLVRRTIRNLRRVFPFCNEKLKKNKPCFFYHLGLCSGACAGLVTQKEYNLLIRRLIYFLDGKNDDLVQVLQSKMAKFSSAHDFEKAALLRDQIQGIKYLLQENRVADYLKKPGLASDLFLEEAVDLQKVLGLGKPPQRIECYDISNTSGTYMTGSMVVFRDCQPDKGQYRRFRIRKVHGIDDYAALQEVLTRRFHHDWQTPDLVVIDGGKGQLSSAKDVFDKLNIDIPLISLAKREEEIYSLSVPKIRLPRSRPALLLVQRLRDEAHRFAITYHRKLRAEAFLK